MDDPNADERAFWADRMGPRWLDFSDRLDAMAARIDAALLARAAPRSGDRVIDVGSGTGGTARAFAAAVGPDGSVFGLDIAEPMVARARDRTAPTLPVTYAVGDAQTFAFAPGRADIVVSRFGVMFFADPVAAFRNIGTALCPGGRVAVACWAAEARNPWFNIPRRIATERLGPVAPTPPGDAGPFAFEDLGYVTGILSQAGFAEVHGEEIAVPMVDTGGPAAVAKLVTTLGPAQRILAERDGTAADADAILDGVTDAFRALMGAGGTEVPTALNFVTAVKRG